MIRRVMVALLWISLGAALTFGFMSYQQRGLLLDSANLRYCG